MQLEDITLMIDYFMEADEAFLKGMGADKTKLPDRKVWTDQLHLEINKPYEEKASYYVIWLLDEQPVGHSNVNKIEFGDHASMHLHLWDTVKRKQGLGLSFLRQTIPNYFKHLELKHLICEPFAENVAPNRTLRKLGFEFIRSYETVPGLINFRQFVNRYELTVDKFNAIKADW